MQIYKDIVTSILSKGQGKDTRTGVKAISLFNINYTLDMADGFPLLTTKYVSWKNILVENLWFLSGSKKLDFLHKHGCRFWDKWANSNNEIPSPYGFFWRNYPNSYDGGINDQVKYVISKLKNDPFSRRMVISAWHPSNAQYSSLPPCHVMLIFNVQEYDHELCLNLHVTQRSCDVAVGLPYNMAGYSFILHLFANISGLTPKYFSHSIVDAHIYAGDAQGNYDYRPDIISQIQRDPYALPILSIDGSIKDLSDVESTFTLKTDVLLDTYSVFDYYSHPAIPYEVIV